ncbi:hypothetical protein [Bradyrhizobium neotropicale]|uniref:hypothetical protein n=1 Tax=Bradyrhizobium neotropicale TaxID=1497615 RepID=UPI000A78BAAD|nr:hypothetical protein [Bradyrhizobium neotropicale]
MPVTIREVRQQLREQIGEAIEAYATVEAKQAFLLMSILHIDYQKACIIFSAVQNVRARGEMMQDLLDQVSDGRLKRYWSLCNAFLLKLAQFRNAMAHWQPYSNLYEGPGDKLHYEPALGPPAQNGLKPLEASDFPAFIEDCGYIGEEIQKLDAIIKTGLRSWPEKFPPPVIRQNRAVLRRLRSAKELQPQRPPSKPNLLQKGQKPSAKQRRQRALSKARNRP